jgi:HD superfamily phosphohydrolase
MPSKIVRDSIHGSIKIPDWCIRIVDSPQFQRLRRIKQLGFASLVYPGANHTRFEHSLGVMHIVLNLAGRMDCSERERREYIVAALIHDIAHAPFSHSSESLLRKYLRFRHENIVPVVKGSEIEDVLKDEGLRLNKIAKIIEGHNIVSGDIDADRMDYLVRDSHYTGVAYGVFDLMRLIERIKFRGAEPIIDGRALKAAESLLISRYMMFPIVYNHHVCRIAKKMYEKALERCVEDRLIEPKDLLKMDDYDIVHFLRGAGGYPEEIMNRLDNRKLFKRAIYVSRSRIHVEKIDAKRAEAELAEDAGVDEKTVIVDVQEEDEAKELRALVEIDGELRKLEEVSPLVRSLKEAEKELMMIGVYTVEEQVEKVAKAAVRFFDIRETIQKRLDEVLPIW